MCTYIPLGPEAHVFEFFNFDNCTTNTPASTTNLPTFKCDLSQQLAGILHLQFLIAFVS